MQSTGLPFTVLTVPEAAKAVRVGATTLRRMIAAGDGPAVNRLRHRVVIRSDALAEWMSRKPAPQTATVAAAA